MHRETGIHLFGCAYACNDSGRCNFYTDDMTERPEGCDSQGRCVCQMDLEPKAICSFYDPQVRNYNYSVMDRTKKPTAVYIKEYYQKNKETICANARRRYHEKKVQKELDKQS